MKQLTRIRLVNWHLFENTTISIAMTTEHEIRTHRHCLEVNSSSARAFGGGRSEARSGELPFPGSMSRAPSKQEPITAASNVTIPTLFAKSGGIPILEKKWPAFKVAEIFGFLGR
jgi:hypothetical protein